MVGHSLEVRAPNERLSDSGLGGDGEVGVFSNIRKYVHANRLATYFSLQKLRHLRWP